MPELRQNLATQEWVIIASERAKRPNVFAEVDHHVLTAAYSSHDPACPFCPGNEELDLEITRWPESGPWQTRVVRNKFPALATDGEITRSFQGVQRRIAGVGHHEVLVEHPHHNTTLALITPDEVRAVLHMYQERGLVISRDRRMEHIIHFKNHGERAGASLPHPHSQIIALPMVPGDIRRRMEIAQRYFDEHGQCVFCAMIEDELRLDERIIAVNDRFVAFVLYAAQSPFHAWIIPRRHQTNFLYTPPEDLDALANILRDVLRQLYFGLNDPNYNLIIRSTPAKEVENAYFHWYITIVPRLSRSAGFELGSGMRISPAIPEACAEFLRQVRI